MRDCGTRDLTPAELRVKRVRDRRIMADRLNGGRLVAATDSKGRTVETPPSNAVRDFSGRWSPSAATIGDLFLELEDGRLRPGLHLRHPDDDSKALYTCESSETLGYTDGKPVLWPCRCGRPVCPVCIPARAARRYMPIRPIIRCTAEGKLVVHVTGTYRVDPVTGCPVTRREHGYGGFYGPRVTSGRAQGDGLSFMASFKQLDVLLRALKQGRGIGTRKMGRWFTETVLAVLAAREATGRAPRAKPWRIRWHAHVHLLMVLDDSALQGAYVEDTDRGERLRGPWADAWVANWTELCRRAGLVAADECQAVVPVSVPGTDLDEDIDRALGQVLKYPAKISTMTTAQAVEVSQCIYGLRPVNMGAAWHGNSRVKRAATQIADGVPHVYELAMKEQALAEDIARGIVEFRDAQPVVEPLWRSSVGDVWGRYCGDDGERVSLAWLHDAKERGVQVDVSKHRDGKDSERVWPWEVLAQFVESDESDVSYATEDGLRAPQ